MIFRRNFDQLSLKEGILVGVGRSCTLIRLGLPHKVPQQQALLPEPGAPLRLLFFIASQKESFY